MLQDPDTKISRPRQVYSGEEVRNFVPMADRGVRQLVHA
jgi:citrate synthase